MKLLSQLSFNQNKAQQKILTQLNPPYYLPTLIFTVCINWMKKSVQILEDELQDVKIPG